MAKKKQKPPSLQDIFQNGGRIPYLHITFVELIILVIILGVGSIFIYFSTSTTTDIETKQTQDTQASEMEPDIIEGGVIENDTWPFTVSLWRKLPEIEYYDDWKFCSGALIHPYWIATAAHCAERDGIYISPQETDLHATFVNSSEQPPDKKHYIESIHPHPNYLVQTEDDVYYYPMNDILLMRLQEPVFDVPTLSLSREESLQKENTKVIAMGSGRIGGEGDVDIRSSKYNDIREAIMRIMSEGEIEELGRTEEIYKKMIAAYPSYTCFGDSGSPLAAWNSSINRIEMIGILSIGVFHGDIERLPEWAEDDFQYMHPCEEKEVFAGYASIIPYPNPEEEVYSNSDFIADTLYQYGNALEDNELIFRGLPMDLLHCHVDNSEVENLDEVASCVSDSDQVYQIRRGCSQTCDEGFETCRYGENGSYIGCQPEGTVPLDTDYVENPDDNPESSSDDELETGEHFLRYYWDEECVCTDNKTYKTLRHVKDGEGKSTNVQGRCNDNEYLYLCDREYPGEFEKNSNYQTYWDRECVQTKRYIDENGEEKAVLDDNGYEIHDKVDGIYSRDACEALNDR